MAKMRCRTCVHLDYDYIFNRYEQRPGYHFCGLHGRSRVDPDGAQRDLDHRGGCGYWPRVAAVQLEIDW